MFGHGNATGPSDHGHGMLAQMGAALDLAPQLPMSQTMRELKELQVARQALVKDRTRLLNRIKTQKLSLVVKQGKARLALIARQPRDIDAEICRRIAAESPTAFSAGTPNKLKYEYQKESRFLHAWL